MWGQRENHQKFYMGFFLMETPVSSMSSSGYLIITMLNVENFQKWASGYFSMCGETSLITEGNSNVFTFYRTGFTYRFDLIFFKQESLFF